MKSMPASSATRTSRRLSRQLPVQRSGTMVTARPDEQFAPNRPICSLCGPCMAMRLRNEASRAGVAVLVSFTKQAPCEGRSIRHSCGGVECRPGASRDDTLGAARRDVVVVQEGAPRGAVEVVVLPALERPQEGGEAQKPERQRHRD